jgi:hypothetical protein
MEDARISTKRHTAEEIVAKLRQVDVLTSQGTSVAEAIRSIGVTEVIVIERWRQHYNMIRPHSALGYHPPAPEVFLFARSAAQPEPASPGTLPLAQRPTLRFNPDHLIGADQSSVQRALTTDTKAPAELVDTRLALSAPT